jgi:predicted nucleotidyltransferase
MDFRHPLSIITPTLDGDVLAVLAGAEEEFTGRRIHRLLGHGSEHGVRKAADRLVDQGIVVRRQAGQAKLYGLNRDHLAASCIESLASLRAELIRRLRERVAAWRPPPHTVIIFGSVARAEARVESDLDLLVVRPAQIDEDEPRWQQQLADLERDATAWTGNEARIIEYGASDVADVEVRKLVKQALDEGVSIFGSRTLAMLDESRG